MDANQEKELRYSIWKITEAIEGILAGNAPTVYLYGSAATDDFRFGWSDIDILVLTEKTIGPDQAERLLYLRQTLSEREPQNPYYRLFEGGMLPLSALLTGTPDTVVYWGTSGERITTKYVFDSFCKTLLLEKGVLLCGNDVRGHICKPLFEDLRADVEKHCKSIREYAGATGKSLYTFGWLLDISRCIYTLHTGEVIPKTEAGEWALRNGFCPVPDALESALRVRRTPALFKEDQSLQKYAAELTDAIQRYADVLEAELSAAAIC